MTFAEASSKISNFLETQKKLNASNKLQVKLKKSQTTPYDGPIIVVAGPTASGKSSLAIQLAKKFGGYIINADSRQVYQELKIGTAQPKPDRVNDHGTWLIDEIEHYLYGHVSIFDDYNLFQYQRDVKNLLQKLQNNSPSKVPFLVGGTGLYIDSIVLNYHLKESKNTSNEDFDLRRNELENMSKAELKSMIGGKINKLSPSDRENPHRLIRFIERGMQKPGRGPELNHLYLLMKTPKLDLETRIINRINDMFNKGLIEENILLRKMLRRRNILDSRNFPKAMASIGYQEFNGYLEGIRGASDLSGKDVRDIKGAILSNTMQYVKRQLTWFASSQDTPESEFASS